MYTPGAPFKASIVIPLSSPRAGKPVIFDAECAFIRAFPIKLSSVSTGSGRSSDFTKLTDIYIKGTRNYE